MYETMFTLLQRKPETQNEPLVREVSSKMVSSTGSSSSRSTAAEEEKMKKILADPVVSQILADPRIQELIIALRENPAKAQM